LDDRDLDAAEELGEQVVERARQDGRDDLNGDEHQPDEDRARSISADRNLKSFDDSRSPMNFSTLPMMPKPSAISHRNAIAVTATAISQT
jgi:hypothetical protein